MVGRQAPQSKGNLISVYGNVKFAYWQAIAMISLLVPLRAELHLCLTFRFKIFSCLAEIKVSNHRARRDSANHATTSVTLDSHRIGGRRDQGGYIKVSPLRRLIGENQFKLVEDPPIRGRSASPLPAQFPIAAVAVKQKPVFRMDGDGQVGSPNRHGIGQRIASTATAGNEDWFRNPVLPSCAEDPVPRRHKPQLSALCRLG